MISAWRFSLDSGTDDDVNGQHHSDTEVTGTIAYLVTDIEVLDLGTTPSECSAVSYCIQLMWNV